MWGERERGRRDSRGRGRKGNKFVDAALRRCRCCRALVEFCALGLGEIGI